SFGNSVESPKPSPSTDVACNYLRHVAKSRRPEPLAAKHFERCAVRREEPLRVRSLAFSRSFLMPGREHTLDTRKVHHKWDKRNPPAIEIDPGDTVHCETAEVTNDQVTPGCPASALGTI